MTNIVETIVDCVRDIPWLGLPLGYILHFLVVTFLFWKWTTREENFCKKVFLKLGEKKCWLVVWLAGCQDELESEAYDCV